MNAMVDPILGNLNLQSVMYTAVDDMDKILALRWDSHIKEIVCQVINLNVASILNIFT